MNCNARVWVAAWLLAGSAIGFEALAADDIESKFANKDTVGKTRHNLTQRQIGGGGPSGIMMDNSRSDYAEVCVYCHTPHGANTAAGAAPLWNRLVPAANSFTTYAGLLSGNEVTAPGASSLPCLSCHDGQTAIDAVLNMPGSGLYSATPDTAFLNQWRNPSGLGPAVHASLTLCTVCHSPGEMAYQAGAADFRVAVLGKDLRNDHPIGVRFPGGTPESTGFNAGSATAAAGKVVYFDADGNGKLSKGDPRFYDAGDGPKVECASCHDPHGVAPSGGGAFYPTFLRVSNAGSALCQTCHAK